MDFKKVILVMQSKKLKVCISNHDKPVVVFEGDSNGFLAPGERSWDVRQGQVIAQLVELPRLPVIQLKFALDGHHEAYHHHCISSQRHMMLEKKER